MIAVLGPGGVGGMLAVRTGAICIGREETIAALRELGLTLVTDTGATTAHPPALEQLDRAVELLVVCVKAPALKDALERVPPAFVAGTVVLPLLNGLEHIALLRDRLPGATVVAGSIGRLEAFSPEPGVVVQRTPGAVITAASDELANDLLGEALAPLEVPGIEVVLGDSEAGVLWGKTARMAALAAATAASGLTVGELVASPTWGDRLRRALAEACAVARADGVAVVFEPEWETLTSLPPGLTTSTARDVQAGRPSELDAIAGAVVRAGRRHRLACPELAALVAEVADRS